MHIECTHTIKGKFNMKRIHLQGKYSDKYMLVDDEDYNLLSQYKWYYSSGYARRYTNNNTPLQSAHTLLMNAGSIHIDHINRDRLDNRRCNLRLIQGSHSNNHNHSKQKRSNNYIGVHLNGTKWTPRVCLNGTKRYFGSYVSVHSAGIVANIMRRELHGEYSVCDPVTTIHELYYYELAT